MNCPTCTNGDCVEIEINLKDSAPLRFFSCRLCEARWWNHEGSSLSLDQALTMTTQKGA